MVLKENNNMLTEKESIKISRFLSLVLRHKPEVIGIKLDEHGWTDVKELIKKCNDNGRTLDFESLKFIVATNPKKRFNFNEDLTKIRASQGHSIEIDLNYSEQIPPHVLFHGTATRFINSIFSEGLKKMERHHVHLSKDMETAVKVGQRHGKPVVLKIDAVQMHKDGYKFYVSDNGVWLTESVPPQYINQIN